MSFLGGFLDGEQPGGSFIFVLTNGTVLSCTAVNLDLMIAISTFGSCVCVVHIRACVLWDAILRTRYRKGEQRNSDCRTIFHVLPVVVARLCARVSLFVSRSSVDNAVPGVFITALSVLTALIVV